MGREFLCADSLTFSLFPPTRHPRRIPAARTENKVVLKWNYFELFCLGAVQHGNGEEWVQHHQGDQSALQEGQEGQEELCGPCHRRGREGQARPGSPRSPSPAVPVLTHGHLSAQGSVPLSPCAAAGAVGRSSLRGHRGHSAACVVLAGVTQSATGHRSGAGRPLCGARRCGHLLHGVPTCLAREKPFVGGDPVPLRTF